MDVRLGEDGRRQVMVYTFNPEFLSWAEHESRAAAWGGHIASISSREQNADYEIAQCAHLPDQSAAALLRRPRGDEEDGKQGH